MISFCIACPELPDRLEAAKKHFAARKLDVEFINAFHGETFGILCYRPYRGDYPAVGFLNPIAHVGLVLSHYMVWQMCQFIPGDHFLILEDDCKLELLWEDRMQEALRNAPDDWDIILIGSSNTKDKPAQRINGNIWEVKYPFCTHAYLLRKKAIPTLLAECRDASTKIDILMMNKAYPKLRVYTVLPRIADQRGTELLE